MCVLSVNEEKVNCPCSSLCMLSVYVHVSIGNLFYPFSRPSLRRVLLLSR